MVTVRKYIPILEWLPRCNRKDPTSGGLVGLIMAIMQVPQAMAYALLAGLPLEVGLYACILPLIVYDLFGCPAPKKQMTNRASPRDPMVYEISFTRSA